MLAAQESLAPGPSTASPAHGADPLALDITDAGSLAAAAAQARDVTVLFNNAGVLASFNVLKATNEQMARDFNTNFFGAVELQLGAMSG